MNTSEEMKIGISTPEELENHKMEVGEIKDGGAEAVTGGFPIIPAPAPKQGPIA